MSAASDKDVFIAKLFSKEGLDVSQLQLKSGTGTVISKSGLRDYIYPFSIAKLKTHRTVHLRAVLESFSGPSAGSSTLPPLVIDENHLKFAVPKKEMPVVVPGAALKIPPPVAQKKKRERGSGDPDAVKRRRVTKESREVRAAEEAAVMAMEYAGAAFEYAEPEKVVTLVDDVTPKNMYEVINEVFQTFWGLQFDEPSVTAAFFARIDSRNCGDYGLQDFSHKPCSFPVINEKLDARMYLSVDIFAHDMKQLFQNVQQYYPANHPALLKAFELSRLFDERWEEIKTKLK